MSTFNACADCKGPMYGERFCSCEMGRRGLPASSERIAAMAADTDRELLELAAKAAGLCNPSGDDDIWWDREKRIDVQWNPLTDDGDALRLAVKLDLPVSSESVNGTTWICRGELQIAEPHNGDKYAATRRAVVRAAAEIGKAMP